MLQLRRKGTLFRQHCPRKQKKTKNQNPNEEAFVCEAMTAELDRDSWVVDSGATDPVTNQNDWYTTFEYFKMPDKIHIENKTTMDALGKETIKIEVYVDGKWMPGEMENVLYAPTARRNLFSVITVLDKSMKYSSSKTDCEFVKDGIVKACGKHVGRLFKVIFRVKKPEEACIGEVNLSSKDYLHKRLSYQNKNYVKNFSRIITLILLMITSFADFA